RPQNLRWLVPPWPRANSKGGEGLRRQKALVNALRRSAYLYACFLHEFPQYLPPFPMAPVIRSYIALRRVVMIRTLLFSSVLLCFAHSVLFSQTDEPKPPAAQNAAEQQAPAANTSPQPAAAPVAPAQTQTTAKTPKGFVLEDGTPVRLKTGRSISSADAHVGDTLDFEVLEYVRVAGLLVIPKGGIAFATVTEAQSKRQMARGGKLNVNIDSVRLITHEKAALRAVKEVKGGGHTGVMTGGIVATSIVFF